MVCKWHDSELLACRGCNLCKKLYEMYKWHQFFKKSKTKSKKITESVIYVKNVIIKLIICKY